MTNDEIQAILRSCLPQATATFQPPTEEEWQALESRFSCKFPIELKFFINSMAKFDFPGDILNVGVGPNNGNDTIELTYEFEMKETSSWQEEMIPFYSIGNGDYFCVSSHEGVHSAVYYYYSERPEFEKYADSFADWLKQLPDFLS